MQIIKDRALIEDAWIHLTDETLPDNGKVTVPLTRWRLEKQALLERDGEIGVRLSGEDPLTDLVEDLDRLQLIVLEFPKFTDGRGFSHARLLRQRYGYQGELRASGDFLVDQMYYMLRVGINAFEYRGPEPLEQALRSLSLFSVRYQKAVDGPGLIDRRRLG